MTAAAPIADAKMVIDGLTEKTAREHDPLSHLDPTTRQKWGEAAVEWRRERDKREPLKRDLEGERKALTRDFIHEALTPASNDLDAVFLGLANNDDVAAVYHFRRVIKAVKHAAGAFRDLAS